MKYRLAILLLMLIFSTNVVQAAPPRQVDEGEVYVVQAGDWLSKLADKYYSDQLAWPAIWLATNDKAENDDAFAPITDPNLIEVGQQLWIPSQAEADQLLAGYVASNQDVTETVAEAAEPTAMAAEDETSPMSSGAEAAVMEIALAGPIAIRDSEVSGMAWYGDHLILMPQYPDFAVEEGDGFMFALAKDDILAYLDGSQNEPLEPIQIPFNASGLTSTIENFEGFEAVAFIGDTAYFTVESSPAAGMKGYLVSGTITADLSELSLDDIDPAVIEPQAPIANHTDESLFVADGMLVTLYESTGAALVPEPVAHRFDTSLAAVDTIPAPNVEYRITDATELDEDNRFWAINYFFPGDESLLPNRDPISETFGDGTTHAQYDHVERLVELQYDPAGISLTDAAPVQLELIEDARNWEGLVRLDGRGFLIATDKWPEMILAFIPNEN